MPEEKIIPPDESLWKELPEFRKKEYYSEDIPYYELRVYRNEKSKYHLEILCTFKFFDAEIALKFLSLKIDKEDEPCLIYFLKLSDGRWQKGKTNIKYSSSLKAEKISPKEKLLKLTISLETENGPRIRIIRKKIPQL